MLQYCNLPILFVVDKIISACSAFVQLHQKGAVTSTASEHVWLENLYLGVRKWLYSSSRVALYGSIVIKRTLMSPELVLYISQPPDSQTTYIVLDPSIKGSPLYNNHLALSKG